jgi:putative FmdB family regulatory protein
MPTYDYVCNACGHAFEEFQSMSAPVLKKCPKCKKARLQRLIGTGAGVIFKGSGFYETDYRSDSYKTAAKADSDKASGKTDSTPAKTEGAPAKSEGTPAKTETKAETKAESKPAAPSPAPTAPATPAKGSKKKD